MDEHYIFNWGQGGAVIRVFVSSTFANLKLERDALQRDVFPRLEQLCAEREFQFQAIDLRWGVSTEAALDHRTMRICFEELWRCLQVSPRPNFLILLGNRYGWRPLPEEISEGEFQKLAHAVTNDDELSILRRWYSRDENAAAMPLYVLQSRKVLFADGKDYTDSGVWHREEEALWRIINRSFPPSELVGSTDAFPSYLNRDHCDRTRNKNAVL